MQHPCVGILLTTYPTIQELTTQLDNFWQHIFAIESLGTPSIQRHIFLGADPGIAKFYSQAAG